MGCTALFFHKMGLKLLKWRFLQLLEELGNPRLILKTTVATNILQRIDDWLFVCLFVAGSCR